MKITLLILGIIYLSTRISMGKHLFDSKETEKLRWTDMIAKLKEQSKKGKIDFNIMMFGVWTMTFIMTFLISLFLLLSSVYISNFIFSIISILMIADLWKGIFKFINQYYQDGNAIYSGIFKRIVCFVISTSYIVFVFYNIYLGYGI